jgi:hypothetical protein
VSAQELTYPHISCCNAKLGAAAPEPSGFALIRAKSLISFSAETCAEKGHTSLKPEKSRPWALPTQLAHKVIHKICGQRQNGFSIIDLDGFAEIVPSFRAQLQGLYR